MLTGSPIGSTIGSITGSAILVAFALALDLALALGAITSEGVVSLLSSLKTAQELEVFDHRHIQRSQEIEHFPYFSL